MKRITVTIEDHTVGCDPTRSVVSQEFTDNANFSHLLLPFINACRGDGMEITHDEANQLRQYVKTNFDWPETTSNYETY